MPTVVDPSSLAKPRGYSNGLLYPAGRILFVAGQIGWSAKGELVGPGVVEQFAQALDNILAVVREAGGGPSDVGRLTIFVTNKRRYQNEVKAIGVAYRERFGKHYPAMSLVEVSDLLEDGALVEIEATCVLGAS